MYEDCISDGGGEGDCESKAFAAANAAVRGFLYRFINFFTKHRDGYPAGQLCPYDDCCHDLAIPNIGWWECGYCGRTFYAGDTDSDYEDYHCYRLEKMDEDPPAEIPVAEDLGASWATPKENSMDGPERAFMKKIRDLLDVFLRKETPEEQERAIAIGDVFESIWMSLIDEETGLAEAWPVDIFVEENRLFAILAREGKLYRVDLDVADDGTVTMLNETQVLHQFVPTDDQSRMHILRQNDGRLRVIAVVCTAVMNRMAELDSRSMFDSFIEHAEETQEYPIVNFFHQGERSRLGQADYLARDGYLYIASYVFDDNEFGEAASRGLEKNPEYFGHSIEFEPSEAEMLEVEDGIKLPMYTQGVNTAVTILGEESAAALFTAVKVTQGVQRMEQKVKDDLLKLFDGNTKLVEDFEELVDGTNRTIVDENMIARNVEEVEAEDSLEEEDVEVEELEEEELEAEELEEEEEELDEELEEEEDEEEIPDDLDELKSDIAQSRDFVIDETVIEAISDSITDRDAAQFESLNSTLSDIQGLVDKLDRQTSGAVTKIQKDLEGLTNRIAELEKPQVEQNRNYLAQLPQQPRDRLVFRPSQERRQEQEDGQPQSDMTEKANEVVGKWQGH